MDKFICGGPDALKQFQRGQFCVALQEVNEEPAIVIWPRHRLMLTGQPCPMIVCLSSYHKYFESRSANPTPYATSSIGAWLDVIGMGASDQSAMHLVKDILYSLADDVVRMRPDMQQRRRNEAKSLRGIDAVELLVDGEVVGERAIKH